MGLDGPWEELRAYQGLRNRLYHRSVVPPYQSHLVLATVAGLFGEDFFEGAIDVAGGGDGHGDADGGTVVIRDHPAIRGHKNSSPRISQIITD
jgi:hypothetical protein